MRASYVVIFIKKVKVLLKRCSKTPVITEEQLQKEKERDEESLKI